MLAGYSDADFANDVMTRRSVTGYLFTIGNNAITWSSQRQRLMTLSTTESEYVAAATAAKEVIWLRLLLSDLGCECKNATELYVDNQSAIRLVRNPEFHKRTKHIDIKYHFIPRTSREPGNLHGIRARRQPVGGCVHEGSTEGAFLTFVRAKRLSLARFACPRALRIGWEWGGQASRASFLFRWRSFYSFSTIAACVPSCEFRLNFISIILINPIIDFYNICNTLNVNRTGSERESNGY